MLNKEKIDITDIMASKNIYPKQQNVTDGMNILFKMPLGNIIKGTKISDAVTIFDTRNTDESRY